MLPTIQPRKHEPMIVFTLKKRTMPPRLQNPLVSMSVKASGMEKRLNAMNTVMAVIVGRRFGLASSTHAIRRSDMIVKILVGGWLG